MYYQEALERLDALRRAKSLLWDALRAGGDFATLERVRIQLNYEEMEASDVVDDFRRRIASAAGVL